jgi:hypothetical protein
MIFARGTLNDETSCHAGDLMQLFPHRDEASEDWEEEIIYLNVPDEERYDPKMEDGHPKR